MVLANKTQNLPPWVRFIFYCTDTYYDSFQLSLSYLNPQYDTLLRWCVDESFRSNKSRQYLASTLHDEDDGQDDYEHDEEQPIE